MATIGDQLIWQNWRHVARRDYGLPYPEAAAFWRWRAGAHARQRVERGHWYDGLYLIWRRCRAWSWPGGGAIEPWWAPPDAGDKS